MSDYGQRRQGSSLRSQTLACEGTGSGFVRLAGIYLLACHAVDSHAVDSPPSKVVPLDCPRQNNRSPQTKYRSHTWSPLAADSPPGCRLRPFRNCLCHSTCIWRTAWTLPVQSKQGEATSAEVSAGRGDDTTPIEEESA